MGKVVDLNKGVVLGDPQGPVSRELFEETLGQLEAARREVISIGVLARCMAATLLDASGKGDETALIFSKGEFQAAAQLKMTYQPIDEDHVAVLLEGLTEQKARAAEALEAAEPSAAGVDRFGDEVSDDPALD